MSSTESEEQGVVSQTNFVETPYQDQTWEIIGEVSPNQDFMPLEIGVLSRAEVLSDPMFADYGGFPSGDPGKRWHLPENLAWQSPENKAAAASEEASLHKLTEAELEAIRAEAFERGKASAIETSISENQERLATFETSFAGILQDLHKQLQEETARTQSQAVELALAISKKIVGFAVEINPEYIVHLVNEALSLAGGAAIRKIRVSTQDMEFIEVVGIAKNIKAFDGSWKFEADETVRSGCVVETSAGEIDFQLDVAWDRIKENIVRVIR